VLLDTYHTPKQQFLKKNTLKNTLFCSGTLFDSAKISSNQKFKFYLNLIFKTTEDRAMNSKKNLSLNAEVSVIQRKKATWLFTVISTVVLLFFVAVSTSQAQVRWQPPFLVYEGINNNQGWTGFTQFDQFGRPFITYNMIQMQRMPWFMQVWVRAHEYGHVNRIPMRDFTESGADCWAAQQLSATDPEVLNQVISYMDNVIGNYAADRNHGTGHQQAAWVRRCSGR